MKLQSGKVEKTLGYSKWNPQLKKIKNSLKTKFKETNVNKLINILLCSFKEVK